jgi:hypothetical protein
MQAHLGADVLQSTAYTVINWLRYASDTRSLRGVATPKIQPGFRIGSELSAAPQASADRRFIVPSSRLVGGRPRLNPPSVEQPDLRIEL